MKQLMKNGDESFPGGKHQESGNTKRQMVKDLSPIQKEPLNLKVPLPSDSCEKPPLKSHGGDPGLETMKGPFAISDQIKNQPGGVDVEKLGTP